jgi:hypothetical protein
MVPWSASVLVQVLEQFNGMQQQMVDQFHQSMRMMVEMFSALHREQMGLVRQELDRLRQLTGELQDLQAELRKNGTGSPAGEASRPAQDTEADGPADSPSTTPAEPAADIRIHAWLGERIAALHAERQGRWEKLMSFLKGG